MFNAARSSRWLQGWYLKPSHTAIVDGYIAAERDLSESDNPFSPRAGELHKWDKDLGEWWEYGYSLVIDDATHYLPELLGEVSEYLGCLLYTSPSPRDKRQSRMPSSA